MIRKPKIQIPPVQLALSSTTFLILKQRKAMQIASDMAARMMSSLLMVRFILIPIRPILMNPEHGADGIASEGVELVVWIRGAIVIEVEIIPSVVAELRG